jgi:protein-S-isoprenylcysteine O-methyltransferase Ste14
MSSSIEVHTFQTWRKPASYIFAVGWLAAALLTQPPGFATGWHEALEMLGFLLLIVAALGRVWAFAYIGGRKNLELCRGGPYGLTRNPLYFFSFLGVCGAGLALQSLMLFTAGCVFFLAYHAVVIRAEERRLAALFGPTFDRYCAEVPRFWPRLVRPDHAGEVTLSARLFARMLLEVFWFLAAIVLIDIIEMAKIDHWWRVWTTGY